MIASVRHFSEGSTRDSRHFDIGAEVVIHTLSRTDSPIGSSRRLQSLDADTRWKSLLNRFDLIEQPSNPLLPCGLRWLCLNMRCLVWHEQPHCAGICTLQFMFTWLQSTDICPTQFSSLLTWLQSSEMCYTPPTIQMRPVLFRHRRQYDARYRTMLGWLRR
jgi:hypothetical protein